MRSTLLVLLFGFSAVLCAQQRKVLIIGIDGCRGDALVTANAPHLDSLAAAGIQSFQGNTHPPTWSATGWSTMLTGVWEQKHKAIDNSFTNNQFGSWPHFFARLSAVDPSLDLRSISHWAPINTTITTGADQELSPTTDQAVADAAVNLLTTGDPDVLFLQFDDVDHAGHLYGFSPATPEYRAAIEVVDQQLGPILNAVRQRPADEDWMVIVTTDHGGNGPAGHGGITFDEQRIFTFVSGDGIDPAVRPADRDTITPSTAIVFAAGKHARVSNTAPYQFGTAQDFTIECRVKMPVSWTSDPVFVGNKNWNSGLNPGWVLSTNTSGSTWKFNIGDGVDRIDLSGLPINDNQWHHIAVTCDRDGEVRIFQDGLLLRSGAMSIIGDVSTALQLCFGQDGTTTYGVSLTGTMADVRIWNAALPIETVSVWSGKPLNGAHPNAANLIGHWRMDEGSGGSLANQVIGAPSAQHYTSAAATSATWAVNTQPLITTDLTGTVTQADLVPTVLSYLCIANDPAWQLDGRSIIPVCAPVQVQVRTLLSGPYVALDGTMNDGLRNAGLVPLNEPYTALGYEHRMKGGGESTTNAVLTVTGPDAVVDWIVLEQRDAADPTKVLATRSCLLQRDGDIVGMDGTSWPLWPLVLGNHHLTVHHRNHFGAMSLLPVAFSLSSATVLDLSDPVTPVFGSQPMTQVGSARLHWAGDVLRDGTIKYTGAGNDRDPILLRVGGSVPTNTVSGYWPEDVNLDGVVKYTGAGNDRDPVLITIGGTTPTTTRSEQLP